MNHDDTPMWDDPAESSRLRQLLRAGRTAVSDYDVDQGLARHLAAVQAGTTMPKWAAGLSAARTATPLFNWLVVPMVGATAFLGVWLVARQTQVPEPSLRPAQSAQSAQSAIDDSAPSVPASPDLGVGALRTADSARAPSLAIDQQPTMATNEHAHAALGMKPIARAVAPHHVRNLEEARAATRALEVTQTGDRSANTERTATHAAFAPSGGTVTDTSVNAATASNAPSKSSPQTDTLQPSAANAERPAGATAPAAEAHRVAAGAARSEDDSRLEREMQMLAVAQRVLGTDPARALRLARQGDREFAGSMFSAERKQVGLLALVQLGRVDEARRLGAPFLLAYPNAPWSERLRRALATGHIPAP